MHPTDLGCDAPTVNAWRYEVAREPFEVVKLVGWDLLISQLLNDQGIRVFLVEPLVVWLGPRRTGVASVSGTRLHRFDLSAPGLVIIAIQ